MRLRLLIVAVSALLAVTGCGPAGGNQDAGTGGGTGGAAGGGSGGGTGGGATGGGGGGSTGGGGGTTTGGGGGATGGGGGSTTGGGGGSTGGGGGAMGGGGGATGGGGGATGGGGGATGGGGGATGGGGGATGGGGGGGSMPVVLDFDAGVSLWDGGMIVQAGQLTWGADVRTFATEFGTRVTGDCPPGTPQDFGLVWGTGLYTNDSSLCTVAVHYGLWDVTSGGQVVVELRPGEPNYVGSTNNGVTTSDYGAWSGSIVVVP